MRFHDNLLGCSYCFVLCYSLSWTPASDCTLETLLTFHFILHRPQVMDSLFYEAQRQGRFSFYMTCTGEEAAVVASAAALSPQVSTAYITL